MKTIFSSSKTVGQKTVGYRFHPTDAELVGHFLNRRNLGRGNDDMPIAEVKVCDFEPWDLPDHSKIKSDDQTWYFFCNRDLLNSRRVNRTTKAGFWKSTGKLRKVKTIGTKKVIGTKRTLVFHKKGHVKTEWVMHEYEQIPKQGNFVVCKVKTKSEGKISNCRPNEMASASASEIAMTANLSCGESELCHHLASDLEDQTPNGRTAGSTYHDGTSFCKVKPFLKSQNSDKKTDILVSEEGDWSPLMATLDYGSQDPNEQTDISTPSVAGSLEINAIEVEGPFFDGLKTLIEPEGSLNSAHSHL
ncbi:protein NTM1-like 9 isoform X1 [Ricinus communis]|uniref:NAC domain-containing protein n=2 Tax=Ricinus communis TaxID=3988 RepID=B9RMW8_RICCO|nr:protein NTM1-like 9 isoform X1 [Ricinus communis]EEF47091.1 hypothetical protein RCOM_1340990 [Ricinus communis]